MRWIVIILGFLIVLFALAGPSNVLDSTQNAWKAFSDPNNKGSAAGVTVAERQPGCSNTTLVVSPGETETFERNINCRNLNWERQKGPTIATLFCGNNGEKEAMWYSEKSIEYDGKVTSIDFTNMGESPVQIELFYE